MAQVATATTTSSRPPSRTGSIRSPSPSKVEYSSGIPRPLRAHSDSVSSITGPPPSSFSPVEISTPTKLSRSSRRKSSYDTLALISASKEPGIDSFIPLPARTPVASDTIVEGVPVVEVRSPGTPSNDGRPLTPTRTLSRIPVSAVGNARALAEDTGRPRSVSPLPPTTPSSSMLVNGDTSFDVGNTSTSSLLPTTPTTTNGYKRMSLGAGGGTSKVLSDLQSAAIQARTALDNTRQQLRLSQRSVASLTRQVEDLKDGRERLRLENESLNNVVSRKERLLQEVLERARKAESEVTTLKAQLKTEAANAKKSVSTVTEAVAQSQKAQREYTTLRDSITGMTDGWKKEVKDLQEQMRKRDEAWREEVKEVTVKYSSLVKLVKATNAERSKVEVLKTEGATLDKRFEEAMRAEIKKLSAEVTRSTEDAERATQQAQGLADELKHLRSLMRAAGATKLPNAEDLA